MTDSIKDFEEWKLPLYKIYVDDEDVNLITKIIKRGSQWALGPEIEELENEIKNFVGVDYCLTLNSGTSALNSTLIAYGIGKNDEVIIPSFSFIATANVVSLVQGEPIFCDIEEETLGLDPEKILELIGKKTKAIMPMDYGGLSCKIFEIKKIAEENNLILIEDSAEALGATTHDKKVGSVADTSIFSFCGNKVLTTGEGGAIVTDSKEIYEKIKLIRSHGRIDKKNYFDDPASPNYLNPGYNWRMSSITASLGLSQLKKLDKIIDARRKNSNYISSRLSKHKQLLIPTEPKNSKHIFQMYSVRLKDVKTRNALHSHLISKKILSKIYFEPIHKTAYYSKKYLLQHNKLKKTEKISEQILTLPMYPNMSNDEKNYLIESIDEFFENQS